MEVSVGSSLGRLLDGSFNPYLAFQFRPVEEKRRPGVGRQLLSLAALIIGEESKAVRVGTAEEDNARRGMAVRGRRRQGHGVWLDKILVERLLEPNLKLDHRVGVDVALDESVFLIFQPQSGQVR